MQAQQEMLKQQQQLKEQMEEEQKRMREQMRLEMQQQQEQMKRMLAEEQQAKVRNIFNDDSENASDKYFWQEESITERNRPTILTIRNKNLKTNLSTIIFSFVCKSWNAKQQTKKMKNQKRENRA